jgi:hypothetical protein
VLSIHPSTSSPSTGSHDPPEPSTTSWNAAMSKRAPSADSARSPQRHDLALSHLVGDGLARNRDVSVDLGLDLEQRRRGVLDQVVDALLAAPALGVEPRVDDEPPDRHESAASMPRRAMSSL